MLNKNYIDYEEFIVLCRACRCCLDTAAVRCAKGDRRECVLPGKLTDYADSHVVPYKAARNWVENSGRWHDDDRNFRVHLNWQEYKKHPLTKAELKEKYDYVNEFRFSTSFKYRGHWYHFFATDNHPAVCKAVK